MTGSNLPPGCSSPDGGIDHAWEAVIEKIANTDINPEEAWARWSSQPNLLDALVDIVENSSFEDVAGKYRIWSIPNAYIGQAITAINRAKP